MLHARRIIATKIWILKALQPLIFTRHVVMGADDKVTDFMTLIPAKTQKILKHLEQAVVVDLDARITVALNACSSYNDCSGTLEVDSNLRVRFNDINSRYKLGRIMWCYSQLCSKMVTAPKDDAAFEDSNSEFPLATCCA